MAEPDLCSVGPVHPMDAILTPASVAIVGASTDRRAFGGFVLGNLLRFEWQGALHLVSRSSTEIEGRPCVPTVDDLPHGVDVAVLAIPEAGVLDAVRTLAARGCKAAVLFASGYAETGDEGRARQQALQQAAGAMALIGPNCMGYTNFEVGLALTFEAIAPLATPRTGSDHAGIAVIAQSGFMAATLRDAFVGRGLAISRVVSTGNEASLGVEDALAHEIDAPGTQVVAMYAEQLRRPRLFLALARRARAAGKPIVLLMPGRSARARDAAASHTGAMAGDHATAMALLQREAVVTVDTLDELFDTTAVLLRHPRPTPGGAAFVTGSGAMKNIALDLADAVGLALPALGADTVAQLTAKLPSFAVAENPLDYTTIGVRQPGLIGEILQIACADPAIGSLVLAIPVGPMMAQRDKAQHIVPALGALPKPALLVLTGDNGPIEPFFNVAVQASGVPFFRSADRALRALKRVTAFGEALAVAGRAQATGTAAAVPLPAADPAVPMLAEWQGKQWLAAIGLPVPPGALARSADEAVQHAQRIGYPVVLKAQAAALPHKSDVGGVLVGLADEAALRVGWARLHDNIARHRPGLVLDGALVEALGRPGLELVVGAKRDADWGPVVLVGLGGIWIEALKDVQLLAPDLAEADVVAALRRLKAAPLFDGLRGAPPVDLPAVARAVLAIGAQMRANPAIAEVDINPLLAYPNGVLALDALVVLDMGASA